MNKILNEDEWVAFVRGVYDQIEEEKPLMYNKLLRYDAAAVRSFFYVFNLISTDHAGISMQKLNKAKEMYYYTTMEVANTDKKREYYSTIMFCKSCMVHMLIIVGISLWWYYH